MTIPERILNLLISKRFKSFYWRFTMMFIAGILALFVENIGDLQLPPDATIILGLILGEISKAINNKYIKE